MVVCECDDRKKRKKNKIHEAVEELKMMGRVDETIGRQQWWKGRHEETIILS